MSARSSLACVVALSTISAAGIAAADDSVRPHYVAPLSQLTQPSYVPQSIALSGPAMIDDIEDERPPPPGYSVVYKPRRGRMLAGGITLGVAYAHCALIAAIGADASGNDDNPVAMMWLPVAGPFLQLGSTDSATASVFLLGLGGAQLLGAILLYSGMNSQERVFVRNDLVSDVSLGPMTGGATGMAVSGRF